MRTRLFGRGDSPDARAPVRWFDPRVLAVAGLDVGFSAYQNRYLDRRETYAGLRLTGVEREADFHAHTGAFWFDYVADLGDGGNATYSVLHTMLRPELHFGDERLPRAELIALGGDLAYPRASSEEYQYRFVDLFMCANRGASGQTAAIVALPANHDWYDNLATFARYFIAETHTAAVTLPVNPELGTPEHHEWRWVRFDDARSMVSPRVAPVLEWALERLTTSGR